jgi:hypothetical protein
LSHVHGEAEITATVEASLLSIDEDSGLIVDCSKIEKNLLTVPI